MKKVITAAAIFLIAVYSFGMVYLHEDFESGDLSGVSVTDNDGDTNSWQIYSWPDKGGVYGVESVSTNLTPDNTIVFPSTFAELDSYVSFWVGSTGTSQFSEHYAVYLAIDYMGTENTVVVYEETLSSPEMKKVEVHLKDYLMMLDEWFYAENITLSVRHFDSDNQSSLLIDDFMIIYYPTFAYDDWWTVIPEGVIEPYSDVEMRWWPYDMSAYDYNGDWSFIGYQSAELHYIITQDGVEQPEQIMPLSLNTDPEYPETFVCTVAGMPMGTYMEYWAEITDNSGYNLLGSSEHFFIEWGEVNFAEGFEYEGPEITPPNGWMPDGWVTFQTGDVTSSWDRPWEVDVAQQNVHTGEYSVTSASQNNFGEWLTENYMVSPRIRVNGTPKLKYYVNAQTKEGEEYRERWTILISTVEGDGTDIENFVEVQKDSIIPTLDNQETWYEKIIDLSSYQDQYVRIMWKHNYTSTTAKLDRFLNIDDISIAEMPVVSVQDSGNAAYPDDDVQITVNATDYSGINNVTVYYRINGGEEQSFIMTDVGDDTFTGVIPGQPLNSTCSWYAVATDNSAYSNTTTTEIHEIIWFDSGILEWGSPGTGYTDYPEPISAGYKVGMDWNFGTKGNLFLNQIEIGLDRNYSGLRWKLVEFDGEPTTNVIGDLSGTWEYTTDQRTLLLEGNNTPIYGHVALIFEFDQFCELMLDESGNKSHAWQWNSIAGWTTNDWGAFYIKMYVSQTVDVENETVVSSSELYQNYPNPFNPTTSISFYNNITGDVNLTIYNVKGEMVANLIDQKMEKGFNKVDFDASMLNSGVYYYTLETPEKTMTKKMILIK